MPGNKALLWAVLLGLWLGQASAEAGILKPLEGVPVPAANPLTVEKVELGKKLFFDRRLSGDGTMSCASCHQPGLAFTDGQAISLSYPTTRNWRNAPTLINVAFNQYFFHDGRASTLEEQALFPIMSNFEMNQNLDFLEEEIRSVPAYVAAFKEVFGSEEVSRERIAKAIAAFERTLVSRGAPLDRYLQGETGALSAEAQRGLGVFTGKGECAKCHFGPNLNDSGFYALQVPEHPDFDADPLVAATRRFVAKVYGYEGYRSLAEDPGRYLITKDQKDWKAFKTPTLREVSKTGPYMHNGIFANLEEVIEFFDQGGGPGNTALRPLQLSGAEKQALRTFLVEALSGPDLELAFPEIP